MIEALGFADYDHMRSTLGPETMIFARNSDQSKIIGLFINEKHTRIEYEMDNLKDASEDEMKDLIKNYESVSRIKIPKYEVITVNQIPFLCCHVYSDDESIGYADMTIKDGKLYLIMIAQSDQSPLSDEMQKEFDSLNATFMNNFYLGSSDTSLVEGSKAALEKKYAELNTESLPDGEE